MTRPAIIVAVLLAAAATAPAASGHFPQSATGTVPAGGTLAVSSSPIPPDATQATITSQPTNPADRFFADMTKILAKGGTRGQRVMFCVAMYGLYLEPPDPNAPPPDSPPNEVLGLLLLTSCLHIALTLQPSSVARAAAAGCPQQVLRVPIRIRRTGGRYAGRLGTPRVQKRLGGVRMTCRRTGRGVQIRLRSRGGKPLRSTLGRNLSLGYVNPSRTGSSTVRTTFAVR